jgi:O-antigen ligase
MRPHRLADGCWAATLMTLPLVGVGLSRALGGPDLGTGVQPAYVLVAAAWALRLGAALAGRAIPWPPAPDQRPAWAVAALAVAVVLLSGWGLAAVPAPVVGHEAWPRFWRQVAQLLLMLGFMLYAACWTRGAGRWRSTVNWLGVGVLIQIIYAPLQAWHVLGGAGWLAGVDAVATSNPGILSGSEWLYLGGFTTIPRVRGTMCEPLYLGSFILAVLPVLLVARRPALAGGAALLLLATWSRGAWLALLGGLMVWWLARRRARLDPLGRRWLLWGGAGIAGLIILVVSVGGAGALWLPVQRLAQIGDPSDWSNLTRLYSAQAAWRAFTASPIVGVGWGQFPYHFYGLVDLAGLQSQFTWPVVNSIPLLVLGELGLVGLGAFTGTLVWAWRATWRQLGHGSLDQRARLAALAAAMAATSLHLCVFSQYNLPHLWVLPGLWLAAIGERPATAADER